MSCLLTSYRTPFVTYQLSSWTGSKNSVTTSMTSVIRVNKKSVEPIMTQILETSTDRFNCLNKACCLLVVRCLEEVSRTSSV